MKSMKKVIALTLAAVLVLCVAGCSKKNDDDSSTTKTQAAKEESANEADKSKEDKNNSGASDKSYTLYDDLPITERITFHEVYISAPLWREEMEWNAWNFMDSTDYLVTIAFNVDEEYTGALEDILDDTYDEFTGAIAAHAVRDVFTGYTLDTKEKVTLDCGAEAIHFEGKLHSEEFNEPEDYFVYGYSFVYDGATITIGGAVVNSEVIDDYKDMIKDLVDRMVKTVRMEE